MSQIPYVNQLGNALEAAISADAGRAETAGRRAHPRIRVPRGRGRLIVVFAVLALTGGAWAATQQSSVSLVADGIACYGGSGTGASAYFDVEANGRSPQAACAAVFRADGPSALRSPQKLVACAGTHFVAVFERTRSGGQCRRLDMAPLQSARYAAGERTLDALVSALSKLGAGRNCVPVGILTAEVEGVLRRLGWTGWRARLQAVPRSAGRCGLFEGTGSSFSDPTASIDSQRHIVWIVNGPLPSLLALTGPLDFRLLRASGRRCYTPAGARALARDALTPAHVKVAFAVTSEPAGGGWAYAQSAYSRGCAIVVSIAAAAAGRTVDVWINSKSAPRIATGEAPSPGAYR